MHAQPFFEHAFLRGDHVVVIVAREIHPHPVARLGRTAVAEVVGQDHIGFRQIERLARAVQLIGELGTEELRAAAAGAVEHHNRIVDLPPGIAVRRAERGDVHAHIHRFAGAEVEIAQGDILLLGLRLPVGCAGGTGEDEDEKEQEPVHGEHGKEGARAVKPAGYCP